VRQGRQQITFDQVEIAARHRLRGRRCRHHAAPAPGHDQRSGAHDKLNFIYRNIELPTAVVLQKIERNGVQIDAALLQQQSAELGARIAELEAKAHELAEQPFNLGSPKQIGEIFFEKLKLPVVKTPSGAVDRRRSAAKAGGRLSAAESAAGIPQPVQAQIDLYRQAAQGHQPGHGRVHTNYAQAVAVRPAGFNDPNLQNIPIRTKEGRRTKPSSHRPAVTLSRPTIRRSNCASWRTFRKMPPCCALCRRVDIHRATQAKSSAWHRRTWTANSAATPR
jgi:DNA polymerase-1